MPIPTRPAPGAIIDPTWGQWEHDEASPEAAVWTIGATATAAAGQTTTVTSPATFAFEEGLYLLIGSLIMATPSNLYLGLRHSGEAAGFGYREVMVGANGGAVQIPCIRFMTFAAPAARNIVIEFGFSGTGATSLRVNSQVHVVKVGADPSKLSAMALLGADGLALGPSADIVATVMGNPGDALR